MTKLFTLTVPDMQWINLQLTGAPQEYSFATLEEGTFYQFKSGENDDIAGQAAQFLNGFRKLAPFAKGNEACAFVGALAFLEMNGQTMKLFDDEALEWLTGAWADPATTKDKISKKLVSHAMHGQFGVPDSHEIVEGIMERYASTLESLAKRTAAA